MPKTRPTGVSRAAYNWWKMHRPAPRKSWNKNGMKELPGWTEREHLRHPTVNCATDVEKRLANAVAKEIKSQPKKKDARTGKAPLWCMDEQRFVFPGKYGCCESCGSTSVITRTEREEELKEENG